MVESFSGATKAFHDVGVLDAAEREGARGFLMIAVPCYGVRLLATFSHGGVGGGGQG